MEEPPESVAAGELRQDVAAVFRRLPAARGRLIVTEHGRPAAVLLSLDAYERGERQRELLHLLVRGEAEVGDVSSADLDSVLADADEILPED